MKFFQLLTLSLSLFAVTACQPSLVEFQPASDSLFKISFSYPDDWIWEEQRPFDELPPDYEPPPSELIILQDGNISIQVYLTPKPHTEAREWINFLLSDSPFTVLEDNAFQIDGHEARRLTLSSVGWSSTQGNIDVQDDIVYLFTEDRYYTINLSLSESEIDIHVRKEFEELVQSIRVLQ
jgi:hypothetical protein